MKTLDYFTSQDNTTTREHLAAIIQSSHDAIISKDLQGIIRSWNRGAERIFGYRADEAVGQHISMLVVPDRADEVPNILERITRGERIDHYETIRQTKDGKQLAISLTVSPIRDESGKIVGASKIARDITAQICAQRALEEANEQLVRSNRDLEQFAYSASHDLQEPLRMICAYSDMLKAKFAGQLGPSGEEYLGYVLTGALQMDKLLHDLRAFTQASTQEKNEAGQVDPGEVLERALVNLKSVIETSGAVITQESLPPVKIHAFQLQQLFQNLIGNAIRYRKEETPAIHIGGWQSGAQVGFSIRDNGIGIDPQYKEQIFGLFKRLHTSADYPGTGMGLAICQRIVERAGGRIWVESELGRGATFFFTLPGAAEC